MIEIEVWEMKGKCPVFEKGDKNEARNNFGNKTRDNKDESNN